MAAMTAGVVVRGSTIERYITYGGLRGFIDVYCAHNNTYYEIKSALTLANRRKRVDRQLKKYETIFAHVAPDVKPGTDSSIAGQFTYKDKCIVNYEYVDIGLVVYTCIPIDRVKAPRPNTSPENSLSFDIGLLSLLAVAASVLGTPRETRPYCHP